MNPIVLAGLASLCLSLALTPVVRDIAIRLKLIDSPDNLRKIHKAPVARAGGVAVALAYFGGLATLLLPLLWAPDAGSSLALIQKMMVPIVIVFLTGLLDDIVGLRPLYKLIGQMAAACVLVASGVTIEAVAGNVLPPVLGGALAVLWLVGCTNAFNLIDGLDGLAAGVGLVGVLAVSAAGILVGDVPLAVVMMPLALALLGFLRYNFQPASVFLGDSGSLFIGFVLGSGGLLWANSYGFGWSAVAAPLMAFAVPLLDLSLSIARRFLTGRPIFGADKGHIHHRLLSLGLGPRNAAVTLYGFAAITAVLALVESSAHDHVGALVGVVFCCVVLAGVRRLGYVEFEAVHDAVASGAIRRLFREEICLRHFEISLRKAVTVEEHWTAMQAMCKDLGFVATELKSMTSCCPTSPSYL